MAPVQIPVNNLPRFSQTTVATDEVDDEYLRKPQWISATSAVLFIGPKPFLRHVTFGTLIYSSARGATVALPDGLDVDHPSQTLIAHVIRGTHSVHREPAELPLPDHDRDLPLRHVVFDVAARKRSHGYWLALPGILGAYMPHAGREELADSVFG